MTRDCGHSTQRALLLVHAQLGPGCHAHYSREDNAPLDSPGVPTDKARRA
ncbi:unnamed protein product, partial [Staurois parvus]